MTPPVQPDPIVFSSPLGLVAVGDLTGPLELTITQMAPTHAMLGPERMMLTSGSGAVLHKGTLGQPKPQIILPSRKGAAHTVGGVVPIYMMVVAADFDQLTAATVDLMVMRLSATLHEKGEEVPAELLVAQASQDAINLLQPVRQKLRAPAAA